MLGAFGAIAPRACARSADWDLWPTEGGAGPHTLYSGAAALPSDPPLQETYLQALYQRRHGDRAAAERTLQQALRLADPAGFPADPDRRTLQRGARAPDPMLILLRGWLGMSLLEPESSLLAGPVMSVALPALPQEGGEQPLGMRARLGQYLIAQALDGLAAHAKELEAQPEAAETSLYAIRQTAAALLGAVLGHAHAVQLRTPLATALLRMSDAGGWAGAPEGEPDAQQLDRLLLQEQAALLLFWRIPEWMGQPPPPPPVVLVRKGALLPPLRTDELPSRPSARPGKDAERAREPLERLAAALFVPGQPVQLISLGDASAVFGLGEHLLRAASAGQDPAPDLARLGEVLLRPVAPYLPSTPLRRLYVQVALAPELAAVPLAALPLPDGRPLCARSAVVLAGRPGVLLHRPPSAPPAGRNLQAMLLLGAPLLRDPPLVPPPLLATYPALRAEPPVLKAGELYEVNHVLRQYRFDPRGGPLIGLGATKSRLRAWLPSSVVHLLAPLTFGEAATAPAAPTKSEEAAAVPELPFLALLPDQGRHVRPPPRSTRAGILLAGSVNQRPEGPVNDDGVLTAEELAQLELRAVDLLVLSGPLLLPTPRPGQGLPVGAGLQALRQAGHQAGARAMVLNLWRPPEADARRLMQGLYGAWMRSGDLAEALRSVQVEMQELGVPALAWGGLSLSL